MYFRKCILYWFKIIHFELNIESLTVANYMSVIIHYMHLFYSIALHPFLGNTTFLLWCCSCSERPVQSALRRGGPDVSCRPALRGDPGPLVLWVWGADGGGHEGGLGSTAMLPGPRAGLWRHGLCLWRLHGELEFHQKFYEWWFSKGSILDACAM